MSNPPNSRFVDLGGGMSAELISDQIQIFYDPTTQACRAIFNGHQYIKPAAVYLKVGDKNDMLHVQLDNRMLDRVVPAGLGILDPVTGIDLSQVSIAGMVILHKFAYDKFHNERAAAIAAALAAGDPMQTPNATLPGPDVGLLEA